MAWSEHVIEEVRSLNEIVDVIGGYLSLKKAGRNFKANCPFHDEKTASFVVSPDKQIFHCFGCGEGGNVLSFVMKQESLNFPEAVELLAERAHYELPQSERFNAGDSLYELFELAQIYYQGLLWNGKTGEKARAYLSRRSFADKEIKEAGMGFASDDWQGLISYLKQKGIQESQMQKAGLVSQSAQGRWFDMFRNRIIIPIRNLRGKTIAFGGRGIGDEEPKYLNSPESPIFKKRAEFFGMDAARNHLREDDAELIVTEGYFDQLRLRFAGFNNAVATLGTSLTDDHVRLLSRFVHKVLLVFDGDKAGVKAAIRSLPILLKGSCQVRVLLLPRGKDPDDFIQESGREAFAELIAKAPDFYEFYKVGLKKSLDASNPEDFARGVMRLVDIVSAVPNWLVRDQYLGKIAQDFQVDERSLKRETDLRSDKNVRSNVKKNSSDSEVSEVQYLEEELMLVALLIQYPSLVADVEIQVTEENFKSHELGELFGDLLSLNAEEKTYSVDSSRLLEKQNPTLQKELRNILLSDWDLARAQHASGDCAKKIKKNHLRSQLKLLRDLILGAENEKKTEEVERLVRCSKELLDKLKEVG